MPTPNFQKLVSRKHALLLDDILVSTWNDAERIARCTGLPERVSNLEAVDGDFYFDQTWVDELSERYSTAAFDRLDSFMERGIEYGEASIQFARGLPSSLETREMELLFQEGLEHVKNLLVFLPLTHPLAKAVERQVVTILEKRGLFGAERDAALLEVSRSKRANGPAIEEEALRDIRRRATQDPAFDLGRALEDHARAFSYLGYREPFSPGYSPMFFRERYADMDTDEASRPSATTSFTWSADERRAIELLQDFVFFRNYRTEKLYESLFFLEPLWKELALRHGLRETDLGWYREQECRDLFERGARVDRTVLETRRAGHGFLLHDDEVELIVGAELADKKKRLAQPQEKLRHLKGMSACRGIVRGTVKVLRSAKEQIKILEGDILVTSMTTPDYLPAMKRAAGFVTDEGGITCHAAIVSRELGKPCVIGTKCATSALKDGQIVTVNGDTGCVDVV